MDLNFTMELTKASEVEGKYYVEGVCSTTDADYDKDIISTNAILGMVKSAVGLPIVKSHNEEFLDSIGTIVKAEAQDNNTKLYIQAELDADDTEAMRAYKKIIKGAKVGFSIGGNIGSVGKSIGRNRVIEDVKLSHIMLTSRPKNAQTFALAIRKSLDSLDKEPKMTFDEMIANADVARHIETEINKAVEAVKAEAVELAKAGAKFSNDSLGVIKDIYNAGDSNMKSLVAKLLGADWELVVGKPTDGANENGSDSDTDPIGIAKSINMEELKKSIIDSIKIELALNSQELGKGNQIENNAPKPMFENTTSLGEALRRLL